MQISSDQVRPLLFVHSSWGINQFMFTTFVVCRDSYIEIESSGAASL